MPLFRVPLAQILHQAGHIYVEADTAAEAEAKVWNEIEGPGLNDDLVFWQEAVVETGTVVVEGEVEPCGDDVPNPNITIPADATAPDTDDGDLTFGGES